jgi:hypothetical protein
MVSPQKSIRASQTCRIRSTTINLQRSTDWNIFGRIDVVATAQAKILPNDRTKTIYPFETAIVKAIHEADGQSLC